ncbi:MAG TPA: heat-inducible transcriptional repressor HrcA [Candidatus Didemnitutus sp.]|nr:heat-inducible transcriptional repressor HrcA [Candidatus Didemnitutus sp.]
MSVIVPADHRELNDRERAILRAIVQLFILHATPVGSRVVSRYLERSLPLSPATIRNTMSDLEARGYITHPHTSAGRMPTDLGYRFYVDSLVDIGRLPTHETDQVVSDLLALPRESVMRDASRILGSLSRHLAMVQLPLLREALVQRVELIPLSSERLLVVIALDSDIVRTLTLETNELIEPGTVEAVSRQLNERLAGRPLSSITTMLSELLAPSSNPTPSLFRLFVEQVGNLVSTKASGMVHISGAQNLITQPEFEAPDRLRSVIELVENEDVIVHLLGSATEPGRVSVTIGNEFAETDMRDYAMIATTYRAGHATGSLGIIGPRRMDYGRMISIVQLMSSVLTRTLGDVRQTPDETDVGP